MAPRPRPAQLDDVGWLQERIDEGMPHSTIASLLDCNQSTVSRALKVHGLRAHPKPRENEKRDPCFNVDERLKARERAVMSAFRERA